MMDCLECRRELLIDPRTETIDLLSHITKCKPCKQEREKLLSLEDALEKSLHFEIPIGLADRVLDIGQNEDILDTSNNGSRGAFSGRVWQMAASIILGVGLMVYLGLNQFSPVSNVYALETAVINHITDELPQLHEKHEVSNARLTNIMTAINTETTNNIGQLNSASKCQIRKNSGAHLILNGENGPVTVLVMPGEHIDKDLQITSSRFKGTIYPTPYGSIAVVGEKGEQISPIAEKMLRNITAANS